VRPTTRYCLPAPRCATLRAVILLCSQWHHILVVPVAIMNLKRQLQVVRRVSTHLILANNRDNPMSSFHRLNFGSLSITHPIFGKFDTPRVLLVATCSCGFPLNGVGSTFDEADRALTADLIKHANTMAAQQERRGAQTSDLP
jgi:hypothetical protein